METKAERIFYKKKKTNTSLLLFNCKSKKICNYFCFMHLVKTFLRKFNQNLDTKKLFFCYFNQKFTYKDLKDFYLKFLKLLKIFHQKRRQLRICTLSEKNFELYASITSTILSKNICIPLDPDSPDKFIKEIVDQVNPDLILIGEIKNSKLINFFKKEKFIL